jgi:plasmid maintenance system antidote protein VapI
VADADSERLPPVHPGDVLADRLADARLGAYALAGAIHVPLDRASGRSA